MIGSTFWKKYIIGSKFCGKTWLGAHSGKKNIIDSTCWQKNHDRQDMLRKKNMECAANHVFSPECVDNLVFPQNVLWIMDFLRMCCQLCFFPRICCQSCLFFPECAANHVFFPECAAMLSIFYGKTWLGEHSGK
jgi:hypothetical protein